MKLRKKQKGGDEMKKGIINLFIGAELHQRLKIYAAKNNLTIKDAVISLLSAAI